MEIVNYPDPILRRQAVPLTHLDQDTRRQVAAMFELMYAHRGVGLAAPQVGWSVRLFVVNPSGEPDPELERVYINPQVVTDPAGEQDVEEEGCLSIPGVHGRVRRHTKVHIKALDLNAQPFEEDLTDLPARIVQHENDHLDGILFISRLSPGERLQLGKALKKLEAEYRDRRAGEQTR